MQVQVDHMFVPNHWDSFCSELGQDLNCAGLLLVSGLSHIKIRSCLQVIDCVSSVAPQWRIVKHYGQPPITGVLMFCHGPALSAAMCHIMLTCTC